MLKKLSSLLILSFVILFFNPISFSATPSASQQMSGQDWEWSPTISTLLQLQNINLDLSDSYTLANDIDATATVGWNSGVGFVPIGNLSTPFAGSFNGNSYTISNLFIDLPSTNNVGLFGYTSGATISNTGLLNVNITGQEYVGGLAGLAEYSSAVSNSYAIGSVTGSLIAGGLVGDIGASGSISDSYSEGSTTASNYVGGLMGVGEASSNISNSYSSDSVTGSSDYVGGLAGYIESSAVISNSYATGSVTGGGVIGGLVGENDHSTISNSYATGSVTGTYFVGGLVGYTQNSFSVSNSFATGAVTGSGSDVGGLIGYDDGSNTLTNNWWYNSLTYGIGSNGTAQSTGNWQMASGVSDFYSSSFTVYTGSTPWDFTSIWFLPSSSYPSLR